MSQHPFSQLQTEYAHDLAILSVVRAADVDRAAKLVLSNIERYQAAVDGTNVPAAFVGALDLRESDCNPRLGLGQGDPYDKVSVHVPKGKGPFKSWADAAKFYIHYDHLDDNSAPWSMEYACYKGEAWNGYGPRGHGMTTGYLWSGTNIYHGGKYIADGVWSANTYDKQLGIIPVILRIAQIRPDLAIGTSMPTIEAPSIVPTPEPPPVSVGGSVMNTKWLQDALNKLVKPDPLLAVDGNYGRRTKSAVRTFQQSHNLKVDGLAGTVETIPAIKTALAELPAT